MGRPVAHEHPWQSPFLFSVSLFVVKVSSYPPRLGIHLLQSLRQQRALAPSFITVLVQYRTNIERGLLRL